MKIVVFIMAIIIMLIIPSMLMLSKRIDELREDLNKSNDYKNELENKLITTEKKFTFYKTELEKRIAKFNDNAYKYKEDVKSKFGNINSDIKSLHNKNQNFAMQLGKLRNNCKNNTNDLIELNDKITEYLEK